MRISALLTAPLAALAIAGSAFAADLRVSLDEAQPLALSEDAAGVAIGNPSIAGVTVQGERLLFVTGRAYGSTNLVVVNRLGKTIVSTRVTVVPDETNTVMLTRGVKTQRFDCAPQCRRRPDLSDDADAFTEIQNKITARAGSSAPK